MQPDKNPGGKAIMVFIGVIFILVGMSTLRSSVITGVIFICFGIFFLSRMNTAAKQRNRGNFPGRLPPPPVNRGRPAETERSHPAETERRLRKEALAPDEKSSAKEQSGSYPRQAAAACGFRVSMSAEELARRRDDLKGLLDSGIITDEEYRDRLQKLR